MQGLTWAYFEAVSDKTIVGATCSAPQHFISAIARIIKQRMAYVAHMCTYLVRSSRFQLTLDERDIPKAFQYFIVCNRRFANAAVRRKDRHLQSVVRIARYVAFYAAFISFYIAPHQ